MCGSADMTIAGAEVRLYLGSYGCRLAVDGVCYSPQVKPNMGMIVDRVTMEQMLEHWSKDDLIQLLLAIVEEGEEG